MTSYLDRSCSLLGEETIKSFKDKTVLIFGLGGVGGTALECLARSGFTKFILVDMDVVDESNLNRQILYCLDDVGKAKVECAKAKILKICKDIDAKTHQMFVDSGNINTFDNYSIDFIVDAIDKIPSKLAIVEYARKRNIPFIVSLGMGNRINPEKVLITKLNKTENDPLAKKLRYEFKQKGIDLKEINVVFSTEEPLIKDRVVSSMMMVPSTAGLLISRFIIESLK